MAKLGLWVATAIAVVLAGCSGLPGEGPASSAYPAAASQHLRSVKNDGPSAFNPEVDFILVDITAQTADVASAYAAQGFQGAFRAGRGSSDFPIGVGDTVRVTIFEAGSGGLFTVQGTALARGNYVDVPDQEVLRDGTITVPYGGSFNVAGRRPGDVATEIAERLKNRAIEPQVVVSIVGRKSNLVTVGGDANKPGRFPLTPKGDRLLDVIAQAEGSKYPDYETMVRLQRGGQNANVRLSAVTRNPGSNIFMQPGDSVYLDRRQRRFMVFGSLGIPAASGVTNLNVSITQGIARSAVFAFDQDTLSLAEGLAKGGGLNPDRADPYTIVLYRMEDRKALQKMGADIASWPCKTCSQIPTVYRLNLRDPSGFFLARKFTLEDQDIIYVANAPITDVTLLAGIVRQIAGGVIDVRDAGRAY